MDRLMKELGKRRITSVLIEGGGITNSFALSSGIVNQVKFFVSPKIIGGKDTTPVEGEGIDSLARAINLDALEVERIGEDLLLTGDIIH